MRIRIGIHIISAEQDLGGTLLALAESTDPAVDRLLLLDPGDGSGEDADRCASPFPPVPRVRVPAPGGAPASFNHLLAAPADLYVFLEAGARPAPGWLEALVAALDADAANAIAGPSTNRCWTAQAVAPDCGGASEDLRRQAAALAARYEGAWQTTAPLYALGDFCLAVRRSVVEAIGGADTAYGRGPCWEMDYAARAARAGFAPVWAQAAFVYRGAVPSERMRTEQLFFEAGKQLYQDRFCGRQEAGRPRSAYRAHCHGDACANFAPRSVPRPPIPLPRVQPVPSTARSGGPASLPLISCIMPTQHRRDFAAQAIAYFRRQDYPARELVIAYRDDADLPPEAGGPDIRLVRSAHDSIGGMRNDAVAAAAGDIVVLWDDDDWHGPHRLSRQAAPILGGIADITGLRDISFLHVASGDFWAVTPDLFASLFVENIAGATMMYRRALWRDGGRYPEVSLREDADFLAAAVRGGARLCRLRGRDDYVYVRHGANTWRFAEGSYLRADEWARIGAPEALHDDSAFYRLRSDKARSVEARPRSAPLVSCIMPTRDRRRFVPAAVARFLGQDYPERELIVVDDGTDPVGDLLPDLPSITYRRIEPGLTLGAKRNLACSIAQGGIIAHWDDDDWTAPSWLSSQMATLQDEGAEMCGLDTVYFYDEAGRRGWRYVYDGPPPWLCGGTLCYRTALWQRAPFADLAVGEDNAFVWSGAAAKLAVNPRCDLYVASVHEANTSPRHTHGRRWQSVDVGLIETIVARCGAAQTRRES